VKLAMAGLLSGTRRGAKTAAGRVPRPGADAALAEARLPTEPTLIAPLFQATPDIATRVARDAKP